MRITVTLRDSALRPITRLGTAERPTWLSIDVTKRYLTVGSWTVTFAPDERLWQVIRDNWPAGRAAPNVGVIIERDGVVFASGQVESFPYAWSADPGQDSGPGTITLSGGDDLAVLANRLTYPDPAHPSTGQTTGTDAQTGPLETVLWHYINVNAGPGALAARKVPALTMPTDLARGGSVTVDTAARFTPLLDLARSLQAAGGPLGVQVQQSGTNLAVSFYVPNDKTAAIRFSRGTGSVRQFGFDLATPTITNAIVGGSGNGAARTIVEATGSGFDDPWQHSEQFVDQRGTAATAQLTQAGRDAIAQGQASGSLTVTAIDTPFRRYGVDYDLGDKVTVELLPSAGVGYPAVARQDVISAVQLTASDQGEVLTASIGNAGTDAANSPAATARLAREVRRLGRRLAALEAVQ